MDESRGGWRLCLRSDTVVERGEALDIDRGLIARGERPDALGRTGTETIPASRVVTRVIDMIEVRGKSHAITVAGGGIWGLEDQERALRYRLVALLEWRW